MASWSGSRALWTGAVAVGVAGAAVVGWYIWKTPPAPPPRDPASLLFRESVDDVGITFQMQFLPNEQGEKFKINLYDHGCGLAVGDYNGDGHDDLYFLNQLGANGLFRNRGDGTFEDVTLEAGVALGDRVCVGASFADYDNDGHTDLFVTSTRGGNVLFRNLGDGTFENATRKAGLHHVAHSQTALFFDYDNDGFLDLFLANTAEWTTDAFDPASRSFVGKGVGGLGQVVHSSKEPNILYRNNGNGTFTDVTAKAELKGRGWTGDALVFDYNNDGRLDLFVTCMFGRCQLYRKNADATFTDVTLEVLGRTPWGGVGARVIDFDNDGDLDLYVLDMHSDMWMGLDDTHSSLDQARQFEKRKFRYYSGPNAEQDPKIIDDEKRLGQEIDFRHDEVHFGNALYRNDGGGKFTEVSDQVGAETFWPWGAATGDFDNDTFEDAFVPSGMGHPFYYWPNYLLMNQGNGSFRNQATEAGIEPPLRTIHQRRSIGGKRAVRSSRCAVTADFDKDGRLEIVTNNFNDQPYFFKNQFPKKNYLALRLRGKRSNRDAIGAVVRLHQGGKVMTRQVLGATGYLSQSSRTVHFGLGGLGDLGDPGDRTEVERIEIRWPSGAVQELKAVAANTIHDIVEPDAANP